MNKNPYEVLGVSESATDDEIKEAYHALARKYHPDKYIDEGLKEMANEKMQQINEAYDMIKDIRAGKRSGYSGSSSGYSGSSGYSATGFAHIRELINMGQYSAAESALNNVPADKRNAEWYYLRGQVLLHRGWYHDATKCFDMACRMDPYNQEYRNARLQMERMSQAYTVQGDRMCGTNMTACDCCCDLICLDSCCECCGGDLISCC
ncbi:MAG: DnaJ domain-containing protein [Clostridia bacterium]|nr:DnaJ domain-containing protein [Clostridia bacterium]